MAAPDFVPFPKIARLSRDVIVTEKIDGTNAQVHITEAGEVFAGSRTRWITPQADNFGFAAWVEAHRQELLALGPGSHFGEWWGRGIQRRYGLTEKRFSLFNVGRWGLDGRDAANLPACCRIVPVLYRGPFHTTAIEGVLHDLRAGGEPRRARVHAARGDRRLPRRERDPVQEDHREGRVSEVDLGGRVTTPCDGNCACAEPCEGCVSLPPYARLVPFRVPLREADTSPNDADADATAPRPQDRSAGTHPKSTLVRLERGHR